MPYINRDICSHFYRYLNKKWRHSNICCIEKFLKSLFIVFLTLYVALYFCKAINDENKWKGKPSLLRVLLVLFKVGEKMQNKRMLTKIYHLPAILSTAPTSNWNWLSSALYWFIVAWNVLLKEKRPVGQWCFYHKLTSKKEHWAMIALLVCPSKHSPRI